MLDTALYVDDLARVKEFYLQKFDLSLLYADARTCAFAAGSTVLRLFQRRKAMKPAKMPGGVIPPHDRSNPLHIALPSPQVNGRQRKPEHHSDTIEGHIH